MWMNAVWESISVIPIPNASIFPVGIIANARKGITASYKTIIWECCAKVLISSETRKTMFGFVNIVAAQDLK